ncbi:glutamate--tRNA ligase family protein [Polyangium sp. y55x31]|uniref:glutamate--tRNA ligase family protein n=1 Tax=Polyangium sp. y55x31 TaxID=3042688 RepID=UPI0024825C45|nr:glutamate--tRNA ligase family protein [Polyangium sp. y55x31]MDI1476760.1 glutamate--tRNA ligase family protein [Polyangium sp. y55x31]
MPAYRGRFAPSPTGALHLGSAAAAIFCAAAAKQAGGALVLRMEDIDRPRVVPGAAEAILDDLAWLGLRWDESTDLGGPFAPYVQSERLARYEAALDDLAARGLVYYCDCSRAEIARAASAPHAGEEGPRYPGTCRPFGMQKRDFRRPPAVRLAVPDDDRALVTVHDRVLGTYTEHVGDVTGDFVLRRGDGVFAYQLAVVVDDVHMQITDVVRGGDLASSSARQILLGNLLHGTPLGSTLGASGRLAAPFAPNPTFAHVPLLVADDGSRLAKRDKLMALRDHRAAGSDPRALVRAIARAYGHDLRDAEAPLEALAETLDWSRLPRESVRVSTILAHA